MQSPCGSASKPLEDSRGTNVGGEPCQTFYGLSRHAHLHVYRPRRRRGYRGVKIAGCAAPKSTSKCSRLPCSFRSKQKRSEP